MRIPAVAQKLETDAMVIPWISRMTPVSSLCLAECELHLKALIGSEKFLRRIFSGYFERTNHR